MPMNKTLIYALMLSFFISSCTFDGRGRDNLSMFQKIGAYKIRPLDTNEKLSKIDKITEKNYLIGKINTVKINEPMVTIKTYDKALYRKERVRATDDITLEASGLPLYIYKDKEYKIIGTIVHKNRAYNVIPINKKNAVLTNYAGEISKRVARLRNDNYLNLLNDEFFKDNKSVKMLQIKKDRLEVSDTSVEYELRFDGMKDGRYYITFMDYVPNQDKNSGNFKVLSFPKGHNNLDINGVKLRVIEVTPHQIEYLVLNDPK